MELRQKGGESHGLIAFAPDPCSLAASKPNQAYEEVRKMKKHKLLKRALAALLTLTMALGIVPMTAFAQETSQAAQEAAAMRALESRVFSVGEEQLTLADLEQSTFVMVTTAEGQNITVLGERIRDYLLDNPTPRVAGTILVSLDYNSQYGTGRVRIYAKSTKITRIYAEHVQWRNSSNSNYIEYYDGIIDQEFSGVSTANAYSPSRNCPADQVKSARIYYDKITVYANGESFYAQNPPYIP